MTETVATYSIPEAHVKMYTANVQAALYKQGGLLYPLMSSGSYRGEKAQVVNFIGPIFFTERTTAYADTKYSEVEHTQRWINGTEYDAAIFIDRLDLLQMIYDPTSPYVDRMREAAARKMDEIAMAKFFVTASTGKDGAVNTVYNTANTVANAAAGMTLAKLRSLRKLFKKRQNDMRGKTAYVAVTADETDGLLGEVPVGSNDYNAVKPLVDGEVASFMGFTFVPYEDNGGTSGDGSSIPSYSSGGTIRQCPAWLQDGMHFGSWDGLSIIISPRPDKNNIKQAHATFTAGATRLDEAKVFMVECLAP